MKCIFCLNPLTDAEKSKEHIIPEALGSRRLVLKDICHPCNNTLGSKVDSLLINSDLIELARMVLDVKGKAKAPPNAFRRNVSDPDTGEEMTSTRNSRGEFVMRVITKHVHTAHPDGSHSAKVPMNADEAQDLGVVKKHMQAMLKGSPAFANVDASMIPVVTDAHVQEVMANGVVEIVPGVKVTQAARPVPSLHKTITLDLKNFKPAVVKIAYELAYHWLGPDYLDDPTAAVLRDIVNDAAQGSVDVDARLTTGGATLGGVVPLELWNDEENFHHAFLMKSDNAVLVYVSIFGNYTGTFVVSEHPERYPQVDNRFLSVDPRTSDTRDCPFDEEILRRVELD